MDEQRLRPREKGPNDPHLGTIDRNFKCNTCEENMTECPGHFGVIKLATPVYHYGFMTKVKKILETVCHNCGKIKATDVSLPCSACLVVRVLTSSFSQRNFDTRCPSATERDDSR